MDSVKSTMREGHIAAPGVSPADSPTPSGRDVMSAITNYVAIPGIFILLVIASCYFARAVCLPILSALVVATMFSPLTSWANRHNIPSWIVAIAAVVIVVILFNLVILLLALPATEWIAKAPEIGVALKEKLNFLGRPLTVLRDLQEAVTAPLDGGNSSMRVNVMRDSVISPMLGFLTPAIGELLLFVGALFFFVMGRPRQRRFLVFMFKSKDARLNALRALNDIEQHFSRYFVTVGAINLVVGVATAAIVYLIGFPNVLLWGVLAFVLNFIPYVGPTVMFCILLVAGMVIAPTFLQALLAPLCFMAFAVIEGQFITPNIVGQRMTLSPLAIFLSVAFWAWIWGPIGAFLAVPFLITGVIIWEHLIDAHEVNLPE